MKKALLAMSILLGLLGFSACGEASNRTVYQYRETEVFQNFYVKKAVYTPGELKLYYRGGAFKDNTVRCYGADFEDLGDAFAYTFQNGVLTIRADFAEQISGLMIDDPGQSVRYRLRYLNSSQFASLTDIFWYDDGWSETGDAEAYYSAEELQAEADRKAAIRQETLETFALLEGTWVCEDGLRKYEFTVSEDKAVWHAAKCGGTRANRAGRSSMFLQSLRSRRKALAPYLRLALIAMQTAITTKSQKRPKS